VPGSARCARDTRVSEEDTKRVLITPVVEALGWDIFDTDEVRNEYRHAAADNPVDYALFLARSPVLFIEAKPLGQALEDRRWMLQTLNYANAAGVDWCLLTNGAEYRIYKVHARGEAEKKLFQTVSLEDPDGFDDACRLLGLLTRERMRGKAIDELWEAWHIDRQVHDVLESVLQDERFVGLIRQRLRGVGTAEIRRSLRRASIRIDYPPLFRALAASALAAASAAGEPTAGTAVSQTAAAPSMLTGADSGEADDARIGSNGPGTEAQRERLQRTAELFALGRFKAGDVLTIRGRPGSQATVIDGNTVEYRGRRMSYLAWGKAVTGWKAIQIYAWALLPDGRTLGELRA
jgi:Type I restriction enzyme R protein N terminus (HSDR_N)